MASFRPWVALSLLLLAVLSEASVISRAPIPSTDYDVVIIGGGPSGLSALSGLSRVKRRAMPLDSAEYRNADTRHIHDVIGSDGIVPAVFRYNARQMISKYPTAAMKNATVASIVVQNNGSSFLTTDTKGETYTSRKIVLATGLRDILPDTPGVKEAFSRGIYWCPWCDGYEHRDQPFGILGSILDAVGSVLEVATLNKDITAFVNGTYTDANVATLNQKRPGWQKQLEKYGVIIENRTISNIERLQDGALVNDVATDMEFDKFRVHLADGASVERGAFITNFPSAQRSNLGKSIGVKIYGEKMDVDQGSMRTAVPGVFAVGDANSDNSTNVPHAMYTGKKAAVYLHVELEKEYAATLISKREVAVRQSMGFELEDLWDRLTRR